MIQVDRITRSFDCGSGSRLMAEPLKAVAVDDLSFEHPTGEYLVITGESGAGKSVLLNLLAGVYPPDTGSVRVFDCDPYEDTDVRNRLAMVRPEPGELDERLTPRKNLDLVAEFYGIGGSERNKRVSEAMEFVGLGSPLPDIPVEELPAGQRSLVSIASGLIGSPELFLLDEPGRYLSEQELSNLQQMLEGLNNQGITTVIATTNSTCLPARSYRHMELPSGTISTRNSGNDTG